MFIVSIMFYLFGFERPPPKSRKTASSPLKLVCLLLLFLVLFKLASGSGSDLENEDNNDDNNDTDNNDGDDDDEGDDDSDDDYDDDEGIDLSYNDVVTSSYDLLKLKRSLLYSYDKGARPLINSQQPIKVFLRIKFVQINNLDEVLQVMTSTVQIEMKWRDEYLTWNKTTYENAISFDPSMIWTPDLTLSNNLNSFKYESHQETYVVPFGNNIFDFGERIKYSVSVSPDGECYWAFPIKLMSVCEFDLDEFPFDKQACHLDFRSSAYLNSQLLLLKWDSGIDLKLLKVGEFSVLQSEATSINTTNIFNENLDEASSHIRIRLVMKRKIIFYLNKIVLPYFVFYIVTAFTYALPVESGEKKSYSTSILISAMIYLKDISNYIPKTSILPLLTIYFDLNLILVFICVFVTTFVYMFYYYDKLKVGLPHCIRRLIAPSRYFQQEKILADSQRFFNSNEVKSNLAHINKQLAKVKQNLRTCESYLFSLQAAGNSNDYLANEMLSLVITLKIFILNHNADSAVIDPDYLDRTTASCLGTNPKGNRDVIDKLSTLERRRLFNFHFINTLENLKLHMVKLKRACSHQQRLSMSVSPRLPTRKPTEVEITNLSKSQSSPKVKFHSECNIRLDVRQESPTPSPQLSRDAHRHHHHHRRHRHHHHHHHHHHHKHDEKPKSSTDNQTAAQTSSPPSSRPFFLAAASTSSISSSAPRCSNSSSKKYEAANKTAKSLLGTLGEYKFQMRSYLRACDAYLDELNHLHKKKNFHYSKDNSYVHEWKYFAIILDRIVLIFFAIVTPICLIIMYLRIILFD